MAQFDDQADKFLDDHTLMIVHSNFKPDHDREFSPTAQLMIIEPKNFDIIEVLPVTLLIREQNLEGTY